MSHLAQTLQVRDQGILPKKNGREHYNAIIMRSGLVVEGGKEKTTGKEEKKMKEEIE